MAFTMLRPVAARVLYPDLGILSEDEENRSESETSDRSFGCCEGAEARRKLPRKPGPVVRTLRLASSYISHLANVLLLGEGCEDGQPCFSAIYGAKGDLDSKQPRSICTFCLSNQRKGGNRRELGGNCLKVRGVTPLRVSRR
ncbi:TCF15 factor, partial [Aegotheles bennettii]|nr:TCF15 factor [Aegotheles bennettii]